MQVGEAETVILTVIQMCQVEEDNAQVGYALLQEARTDGRGGYPGGSMPGGACS